jgi:CheY-like chemotaxis protein
MFQNKLQKSKYERGKILKKRILIVDDEPSIIRLLSLRLQAKNYEVFVAYDEVECVKVALEEVPDLILLDIKMPNEDGIGAFKKLNQMETTKGIPVIFMTAYPKFELKNQVIKMGAKDCISKPFISEDFEQTIALAIA